MQMAHEYQSAAALIRERSDLSAHYHNGWHPLAPPYDFNEWRQNAPSSCTPERRKSVREACNGQIWLDDQQTSLPVTTKS